MPEVFTSMTLRNTTRWYQKYKFNYNDDDLVPNLKKLFNIIYLCKVIQCKINQGMIRTDTQKGNTMFTINIINKANEWYSKYKMNYNDIGNETKIMT